VSRPAALPRLSLNLDFLQQRDYGGEQAGETLSEPHSLPHGMQPDEHLLAFWERYPRFMPTYMCRVCTCISIYARV